MLNSVQDVRTIMEVVRFRPITGVLLALQIVELFGAKGKLDRVFTESLIYEDTFVAKRDPGCGYRKDTT